jgi:hypothetical protein
MSPHDQAARSRRAPRRSVLVLFLVLFLAGVVLVASSLVLRAGTPVDLEGNAVALGEGDVPDAGVIAEMDVVADSGLRFTVPALGMDVPMGELSVVRSALTPPGFVQAYRVRNLGVGLDQAVRRDGVRGDALGQSRVRPGQLPLRRGERHRPRDGGGRDDGGGHRLRGGWLAAHRQDRPADHGQALWTDEPGRVVVITCLQRTQGRSLQNLVITGHLAAA